MKQTYLSLGVVLLLLIISTALLPSTASGQNSNSSECFYYAYTVDSTNTHYSLVKNNSYLIGQSLVIESNCDYTFILNDSYFIEESLNSFHNIPIDTKTITFQTSNNQTFSYTNLTVFPSDSFDFQDFNIDDDLTISDSKLWTSELLAHGITFIILYIFSTSIVYRFAKNNVDNSIEVII